MSKIKNKSTHTHTHHLETLMNVQSSYSKMLLYQLFSQYTSKHCFVVFDYLKKFTSNQNRWDVVI